ncbi:hypothetical protein GCM10010211_85610 [Streptomyces albospinus]|uniref:Uncharacterized protein n=1 Tax=Streptomyces albospinus TaxID=285515 RepID=A0ABQ2VPG5_9ACTN|nr:hypothetical protein [Streptomyces albospinus]GGV05655.1 hypothetical protein GCM10010211_85610 [Streptomyces albospinus]
MRIRSIVATAAITAIAALGTAGAAAADGEPSVGSGVAGLRTGNPPAMGSDNPPAMGSDNFTASNPRSLFNLLTDR